jgi:hypothetical protein
MAQIGNIVINDGQATPVAHTFNPVNIDAAGVARWADRVNGIAVGFPLMSLSLRNPTQGSRSYKMTLKISVPTLEVTAPQSGSGFVPAPTKAYDVLATVDIVMPERSTKLERQNVLAFLKNGLANAVVTNAVENFETVY